MILDIFLISCKSLQPDVIWGNLLKSITVTFRSKLLARSHFVWHFAFSSEKNDWQSEERGGDVGCYKMMMGGGREDQSAQTWINSYQLKSRHRPSWREETVNNEKYEKNSYLTTLLLALEHCGQARALTPLCNVEMSCMAALSFVIWIGGGCWQSMTHTLGTNNIPPTRGILLKAPTMICSGEDWLGLLWWVVSDYYRGWYLVLTCCIILR